MHTTTSQRTSSGGRLRSTRSHPVPNIVRVKRDVEAEAEGDDDDDKEEEEKDDVDAKDHLDQGCQRRLGAIKALIQEEGIPPEQQRVISLANN